MKTSLTPIGSNKLLLMNKEFITSLQEKFSNSEYNQIFVFSSLLELGFRQQNFMELIRIFFDLSNEGCRFLFPSYTYSSRRKEWFDASSSPPDPQNGALSRLIFESKNYQNRTLDPDFSYFICESSKKKNPSDQNRYSKSFGLSSHHEDLFLTKSGVLLIGPVLETGLTPIMHLENLVGVPWREEKNTEYFCKQRNELVSHTYFAKKDGFPVDQFPRRVRLKPLIESLPSREFDVSKNFPWVLFDWNEFAKVFCNNLKTDVFFQSKRLENESI